MHGTPVQATQKHIQSNKKVQGTAFSGTLFHRPSSIFCNAVPEYPAVRRTLVCASPQHKLVSSGLTTNHLSFKNDIKIEQKYSVFSCFLCAAYVSVFTMILHHTQNNENIRAICPKFFSVKLQVNFRDFRQS